MTFWDLWQYSIPLSFSSPGSQLSEIIVVGRASVANSGRTQAVSTWSGRNSPPLTRPTGLYRAWTSTDVPTLGLCLDSWRLGDLPFEIYLHFMKLQSAKAALSGKGN